MVCIDDITPLISIQAIFTLLYLPARLSFHWSARWITIWDRIVKILVAMKLAFMTRAVVETLAIGIWPENTGSQFWLLLCCTVFFHSMLQMLLTSTIQTGFALISFFCGLSFFSPIYRSYQETVQNVIKSVFKIDIGFVGCILISIAIGCVISSFIFAIYIKGWFNTIMISLLITIDYVISFHLAVYNAEWSGDAPILSMEICCNIPDIEITSVHPDGNACPFRFTWVDIVVGAFLILSLIPLEFYRREQCLPMWLCCRKRSRMLQKYRDQKRQLNYGMTDDDDDDVAMPLNDAASMSSTTTTVDRNRYDMLLEPA